MIDEDRIDKLREVIKEIYERFSLIEKEQRIIKEDILSRIPRGNAKKTLNNPSNKLQ
jgi:hypothetical protein